jgi:hypothetical protein
MTPKYSPFRRNRYFAGKLFSADDFAAEQRYFVDKRRLHNRLLYGSGVVTGLNCRLEGTTVQIEPGLAIDCLGREIIVPECHETSLPRQLRGPYICLSYKEREICPMPVLHSEGDSDHDQMSFIEESYELSFSPHSSYAGHEESHRRWVACGVDHPITLARLEPPTDPKRVRVVGSCNSLVRIARRLTRRCSGRAHG